MYSIDSGNTDDAFVIDPQTGEIRTLGVIDYEITTTYTLTVHAVDRGSPAQTGMVTVTVNISDVNDVTPACDPALFNVEVAEDTMANTNILTVACPDSDSGLAGSVNYVISSVDGVATTTPFIIDTDTGSFDLSSGSSLDYETDKLKTVIIHAVDGGGLTGTATVFVHVTDVNEHAPNFVNAPFTESVSETLNIGDSVYAVMATDDDVDDTVTYSIDPPSSVFEIDQHTGTIYQTAELNFESVQSYALTLFAADGHGKNTSAALTFNVVDVNEGIPVFNPAVYSASINENDGTGTSITTVTATDTDTAETVTYTIINGNDDAVFRIGQSGVITIDNAANLDYDSSVKFYSLVVQASDGTESGTATVAVLVTSYNEDPPTFGANTESEHTIEENQSVPYSVVTVAATDNDHGADGEITYSITGGNADNKFSVNPETGEVTLVGELDAETTNTYSITVTAADGGTNPGSNL